MTAQMAIRVIKDIPRDGLASDFAAVVGEATSMAAKVLEKEIPKVPTHVETRSSCCTCPSCRNVIDEFGEFVKGQKIRICHNRCHFCGQAIDWSEYREKVRFE